MSSNSTDRPDLNGSVPPHKRLRRHKTPCDSPPSTQDDSPPFEAFPFMKLPTELRLRVYSLLFPDKEVPAEFNKKKSRILQQQKESEGLWTGPSLKDLRADGQNCYTAILRVSRAIYEEAIDVLYGAVPFVISIGSAIGGHHVSACCGGLREGEPGDDGTRSPNAFFRMVQSISLTVPAPYCRDMEHEISHSHDLEEEEREDLKYSQLSEAYGIKDRIRWLVDRITKATCKAPLRQLRISVSSHYLRCQRYDEISNHNMQEIFWVLDPFMALRGVEAVELVYPANGRLNHNQEFAVFKKTLEESITSGPPPPDPPKAFDALPKLARLVYRLDCCWTRAPYAELHSLRVAHDNDDLAGFLSCMPALVKACKEGVAKERKDLEEDEEALHFVEDIVAS